MTTRIAFPLIAVLVLGAGTLAAHHSTAAFDMTRGVTITGTVTEFRWANPHSYILMTAPDEDGVTRDWVVEIEALNLLRRNGWSKDTLKAGDEISCHGARAKRHDLYAMKCFTVIFPDGRTMVATPSGVPPGP